MLIKVNVKKYWFGIPGSITNNTIEIIESLRPDDTRTGKQLYDIVCQEVPNQERFEYTYVNNKNEFIEKLIEVANNAKKGINPIVHLEIHGSREGLELGNGECLDWVYLSQLFTQINVNSKFNLVLVLSVCYGIYATRMIQLGNIAPFTFMVAPPDRIHEDKIRLLSDFYYKLLETQSFSAALPIIQDHFVCQSCEALFCGGFAALSDDCAKRDIVDYLEWIGNSEIEFDRFKNQFLMLDVFHENVNRFEIVRYTYEDLKKLKS